MYPDLKLIIDKNADIKNCTYFIANESSVIPDFLNKFLPHDLQYIMDKKFSYTEKDDIAKEYINSFYNTSADKIKRGVDDTTKRWKELETKYYTLVNEIFKGYVWSKGEYFGTASIFLMYPRNINQKTFFFPFENIKFDPLGVIAHEMLHFIFYDYINKHYNVSEQSKFKGKNNQYVWQVAETFNTTIENWKPYKTLFTEDSKPYAGCEDMFEAMKKEWNKNPDIVRFLDKWLLPENI